MKSFDSILGINQRNLDVIYEYNPRKYFPMVDDKIRTKEILLGADVPFPETILSMGSFFEIEDVFDILEKEDEFVIKPARGRAGGGILLVEKEKNGIWKTPSGKTLNKDDLKKHFGDILFGVYSFGRMDDRILIERRVIAHTSLYDIYSNGIADIRIITFKNKTVMSMLRIPTDQSDGKANLHQGAIGVSVFLESGITGGAFMLGKEISVHPDSGSTLVGVQIPFWNQILRIAEKSSVSIPLDYMGVDIVIDQNLGPLVLELNARPGLQIQVVNKKGLIPHLEGIS